MVQSSTTRTLTDSLTRPQRWDIFCSVVDNYGDAGVAWRLARQLAAEHPLSVRLFLDDLNALARIAPDIDPTRDEQRSHNVSVLRWVGPHDASEIALSAKPDVDTDVVIEAFGCGLPEACLSAMAQRARPPLWINLEYLSAERWIDGCHALASRHPRLPLERHFFFPGFTAGSGGLLRERDLFARRDAFWSDATAVADLWRRLHVARPASDALAISLFCYPHHALPALFDAWADGDRAIACMVPAGVATAALDFWTGGDVPHPGRPFVRGRLTVNSVPFVPQDDYDRLLWACDLNFVRGEDSFVRAQWAARPFVWHAYPQEDAAHIAKVAAFLERYGQGLPSGPSAALEACTLAWNAACGDARQRVALAWPTLLEALPQLAAHGGLWAGRMALAPDLATALAKFVGNRV